MEATGFLILLYQNVEFGFEQPLLSFSEFIMNEYSLGGSGGQCYSSNGEYGLTKVLA